MFNLFLSKETKQALSLIKDCILTDDYNKLLRLVKQRKVVLDFRSPKTKLISFSYPHVQLIGNSKLQDFVDLINHQIKNCFYEKAFEQFLEKNPLYTLIDMISQDVLGLEEVKTALVLSIVSKEPIHILLFGDPGTGKTKLLENIGNIVHNYVFGLGSGTSNAGLSLTVRGNEIIKGLLPLANNGFCCIDELNLMKERDRASLYSAMENGFVSYDKGDKHITLEAKVTVFATANPGKGALLLKDKSLAKTQIPFDIALLSRFHLVFFIRRHSKEKFAQIAKHLVSQHKEKYTKYDYDFTKDFVDYLRDKDVYFPDKLKDYVSKLSVKLKEQEDSFFIPLTPRKIIAMIRLAKSYAKLNNDKEVKEKHLDFAYDLILKSLKDFVF